MDIRDTYKELKLIRGDNMISNKIKYQRYL